MRFSVKKYGFFASGAAFGALLDYGMTLGAVWSAALFSRMGLRLPLALAAAILINPAMSSPRFLRAFAARR